MALNKKKASEKNEADKMIEEMLEEENSVTKTIKNISNESKAPVQKSDSTKKHPGGRPTLKSKGKTARKQYTLTLQPDMYKDVLNRAESDGISFAKYVERAVLEYIDNHS